MAKEENAVLFENAVEKRASMSICLSSSNADKVSFHVSFSPLSSPLRVFFSLER
jgi:hypothetical protein